jgi:Fur family peroxide stress response transcriptional regulator
MLMASPVEQRLAHWTLVAREAGVKLTHQRLEIFRELVGRQEHPDAESLFRAVQQRVPTVSLDTVYRTLWRLHDLGLISTLGPRREAVRFDVNVDPHHHYVCVRCGMVRDLSSSELDPGPVPASVGQLSSVLEARVEVRGVCSACLRPEPCPDSQDSPRRT